MGSFFSLQSHSEWSTFLTILTILQVLQFLLSLRSSNFYHLRNSTGPKGTPLEYFRLRLFEKNSHQRVPLKFFDIFLQNGCWKIPKGPSFQFFRHGETFYQIFFFIKGSPIHQYFDILKSFCYFWALDMAPTWAVPGLFEHTSRATRPSLFGAASNQG